MLFLFELPRRVAKLLVYASVPSTDADALTSMVIGVLES